MSRARRLAEPWICPGCLLNGHTAIKSRQIFNRTFTQLPRVARARKRPSKNYHGVWATAAPAIHNYRTSAPRGTANTDAASNQDAAYLDALEVSSRPGEGIRNHLAEWQEKYGTRNIDLPPAFLPVESSDGFTNDSMRLNSPDDAAKVNSTDSDESREEHLVSTFDDPSGVEYEYLAPGDFVEIETSDNREPTVGVFVREFGINTAQVYTLSGKWIHVRSRAIPFSIPNFVNPAVLVDILPYLPQHEDVTELRQTMHLVDVGVPREVASPVLNRLIEFWREVQEVYRNHASVLDSAHQILAHETDLRFGTLEKIAKKLLGESAINQSHAALVAVRRALLRSQGFAADNRSHRFTRVFLIHPKDHVKNTDTAASWIRQWQEIQAEKSSTNDAIPKSAIGAQASPGAVKVDRFISKARAIVEHGRKIRPENKLLCVSPSKIQHSITPDQDGYKIVPSIKFSDSDRLLLHFLMSAALRRDFKHHTQYNALVSALLRGVGTTDEDAPFAYGLTYKLLQEMGVTKPYENRILHNEHILLPNSQRSKPLIRLRDSISKVDEAAKFTDTMQHLRRDWKDLNVYAIDGKSAMNIDDGISIEPVPGQAKQWWIRIHVANPTSRINKNDDVSRMAAHMTETYYAPDDHHWLLPSWITQKFMSIAANRPVLTFSARVDQDCNMLEYDVQSGIVRRVHRYTPTAISALLGKPTDSPHETVLTVGDAPQWFAKFDESEELPSIPDEQREELATLFDLAAARSKYRISNGGMILDYAMPKVATTYSMREEAPRVSQLPIFTDAAHFIEGDPAIRVATQPYSGFAQQNNVTADHASSMVQEMMLLAGEIGARWCSDRNVPIMYRGTYDHGSTESIFNAAEFYERYIKPHMDKDGKVSRQLLSVWMRLVGRTATTLTPMRHELSGLDQYAKLTTPLGRYGDMIAHWQIESVLREEARTGKSLVGSTREDYLTFTRAELAPVVPRLRAREQLILRSKTFCEDHWIHQLFFRAYYFHEAELPAIQEVIIHSGTHNRGIDVCTAYSKTYGIVVQVAMRAEKFRTGAEGEVFGRPGDHWEVEIVNVDPMNRTILTRPLRLLYREPYKLDDLLKSDLSALVI